MPYAVSWFIVVALLALWSLVAWGLHAAAVWTLASAGTLAGATSVLEGIALPEWLAPWLPSELVPVLTPLMKDLVIWVDSVLRAAPAMADGLTVLAWVIWAIGTVLIALLGAGLHLLIALWARRASGGSGSNAGPPIPLR